MHDFLEQPLHTCGAEFNLSQGLNSIKLVHVLKHSKYLLEHVLKYLQGLFRLNDVGNFLILCFSISLPILLLSRNNFFDMLVMDSFLSNSSSIIILVSNVK